MANPEKDGEEPQADPFAAAPPEEHPHGDDPVDEAFARYVHHGPKHRRAKKHAIPGENIAHLNLTPMMDIMTMLLVFLVMSFATAPSNINVNLALRPPPSTTKVTMEPATKVTITKEMVLVDDREILSFEQVKKITTSQVSIPEVRDALIERKDQLEALANRGGSAFDGKLLVVADEATPYAVITAVLVTAGEAKFGEYKLVLMEKLDDGGGGAH